MSDSGNRERDLVLAPNEYAFISDQTKGNVNVYVGPYKTSLANTDQPVVFDSKTKRFRRVSLDQATEVFAIAPEGWYSVLKNPAADGNHPTTGTVNNLTTLKVGHKVTLPGPASYPLWPGQMVRVIQGHYLKTNQYLVVRVYDEKAAKENWQQAVIKPQSSSGELEESLTLPAPDLIMGKLLIIRGTEVSFYIPPTGMEVVPDAGGSYVRNAITLERLEYCILLDENGMKRFVQGSAVVFPEPTEDFVTRDGQRKFKAIELNEISGIYIKVIESYEENGRQYSIGEELFVTGNEQMIYYPRPEHAIIRYDGQEIHYAVAIPAGEGRYVLNRRSGEINLHIGPCMFLPDPRKEVIVRRILDEKQVMTWFPGNQEALDWNRQLKRENRQKLPGISLPVEASSIYMDLAREDDGHHIVDAFVGDDFDRDTTFTKPRTITFDNRYDGAVSIDVWTGYAVQIVSRTGKRRVAVGPTTILLDYDETLESITLSTGTPKKETALLETAYLRVLHNRVSDQIQAETADLCQVRMSLSYRVNFEGEAKQWFDVENYVKFLCDHLRSLLRKAIKEVGVEAFYASSIDFVRDAILGKSDGEGKRSGRFFPENGMRVYDVEVLGVWIGDEQIANLLVNAQHSIVERTLHLTAERRRLDFVKESEDIKRKIAREEVETRKIELTLKTEATHSELELALAKIAMEVDSRQKELTAKLAEQDVLAGISDAERERKKLDTQFQLTTTKSQMEQRIVELQAEVQAVVDKSEAVSPDLIAALQSFSDKALAEKMAETMAPLAILGGKSVADVFAQLLAGTNLESVIRSKFLTPPKEKK